MEYDLFANLVQGDNVREHVSSDVRELNNLLIIKLFQKVLVICHIFISLEANVYFEHTLWWLLPEELLVEI